MSEESSQFTAKNNLFILIKDYRARRRAFKYLDDYDDAMRTTRERYKEKIGSLDEPIKSVAQQVFEICDQVHFVFQLVQWKINYLAEGLEHALNTKNPVSLANNARSLVEHVATISTIGQRVAKLETQLDGQQSGEKITEALKGVKSYLRRAYYGKSPKSSHGHEDTAIHINDSLKDLKREVGNIDELYDFLCEYVHPNHGSNRLVSSGEIASGKLNPPEEDIREILDQIRRICSYCFLYLKDDYMSHFASLLRIQAMLDLCFARGAKISTVFAKRSHTPSGNGKSQVTAYFFPKARTSQEAVALTYEFFENQKLTMSGPKRIGAVEDGFIYDVHMTNLGDIWVKIPFISS